MNRRTSLALLAALLAVAPVSALAKAGHPSASAPLTVTVRVEGKKRTLLPETSVRVPAAGNITLGGTPKGACPARSAAGAFDAAVHHAWSGKYYASVHGIFVSSILGEKPAGNDYWQVFIDNRSSNNGLCALRKLHRAEQILLADNNGSDLPLVLRGPHAVHRNATATYTVVAYRKGAFRPVAGVLVSGGGTAHKSDKHGHVRIHGKGAGPLVLHASGKGYVRVALTARVLG